MPCGSTRTRKKLRAVLSNSLVFKVSSMRGLNEGGWLFFNVLYNGAAMSAMFEANSLRTSQNAKEDCGCMRLVGVFEAFIVSVV